MNNPQNKLQKKGGLLLAVCIILLLLAACSDNNANIPPTATPVNNTIPITTTTAQPDLMKEAKDISTRWLRGIPCAPPCFEGITPGKTNFKEAKAILAASNLIDNYQYIIPDLFWDWKKDVASLLSTIGGGAVRFYTSDIVDAVEPHMLPITLAQVMAVYGEPEQIIATISPINHEISYIHYAILFYFSKGFALEATLTKDTLPILNKDMRIEYVTFFQPGVDGYKSFRGAVQKELLLNWEGFKDWKDYCRVISYGKAAPCPNTLP